MIYFGVAGWSYPDWEGVVYPTPHKGKFDGLAYLANFFDTIELNNTFYRIPESKMVESWVNRVQHNPRFRFTAKLWQGFTHEKEQTSEDAKKYIASMRPMQAAKRLGAVLIQYPISFRYSPENQERLTKLVDQFSVFPLVVEFRHRSWINEQAIESLEEREIGFCNVDGPMFREMLKPSSYVTGETGYVRFHGRNYQNWFAKDATRDERYDYSYSDEELDQWIPRIKEMGKKAKDVYVIGNNHFRGQAPANILELKAKTEKGPVDVPDSMLESFPTLRKIAKNKKRSATQGKLF